MKLHLDLTPKLTLAFVLFSALVAAGIGVPAYNSGQAALQGAVSSELLSSAVEKESALETWIAERQSDLKVVGASPELREALVIMRTVVPASSASQQAHNRIIAALQPTIEAGGFFDLTVLDPVTGRVISSSDARQEDKFNQDLPYFINGKIGPSAQSVYYALDLQKPTIAVALPLVASNGEVLAVLAGRLDLHAMDEIIARRSASHRSDDAYLVNASNQFVTPPRLASDPAVLQRGLQTEAVNRCLAGNSGSALYSDYRDVPVVGVYRWLAERQLCLIVKIDQAEAFEPTRAFGSTLFTIGVLALLGASVLASGVARTISRPVLALKSAAARFGRGELSVRLPEASEDEFGILAREFNRMAASLQEKDTQVAAYASQLGQTVEERTAALRASEAGFDQRVSERTAQLEAANKELEAFSYSVSHDLRAPLRAIDGFSRILLRDGEAEFSAKSRRYLQLVRDNTQQMGRLIDDLLAFARLSRQPLQKQHIAMGDLVRQALQELANDQEGRALTISLGELGECDADQSMLKQVWINLLANAIKFTRQRAAASVEIGCDERDGERVYFVRDNGVGFDMQYVHILFGVFQRLHRAEEYEGTGVGLAIVQRIIVRHGGRVWAESVEHQGATFYFTLGRDIAL